MDTLHNHELSNYGGICAMLVIILQSIKGHIHEDMTLILILSQICLAISGSIFYFYSIKKIKKEDK